MYKKIIATALVIAATALPAFAEPPFSKDEVKQLLVGNTYPLGNGQGAMYVKPDGTMDVVWEGKTESTTWKLKSKGRICYKLKMFGGNECIAFQKNDDSSFFQVYGSKKRKMEYSSLKKGKKF